MTAEGEPADRLDVLPVVVSTYLHHAPLPEAEHEAEAIVTLLAEHLNGVLAPWTENGHRTETSIKLQLNTWAERGDSNSVLIWLGHGTSNGFDAWLATYETPSSISYSGVNPQTIAEQINKQWQRRHAHQSLWLLLVIEACGAATFVRKLAAALLHMVNAPERFALIGVGGDDSATPLGQFRRALASALNSYTDNDEQIAVAELVSNLRNRIAPNEVIERGLHVVEPIRRRRLLPSGVTAPLDVYAELRAFLGGLSHDERGHFLPKAQGAEHGELVWYFVGRHTERERVASWIRDHDCGMLIVTGRAGAGKSALLGNVLVQSNAALCDLLARAGYLEPTPSQAAVRPFDAVVHLTGITTGDLVLRLAAAAGLPPPRRAETSGSVDWLVSRLRDRAVSFLVLADALDEAQEPGVIAGSVLRSIAALPHVKVVVGTRASTLEGPDQPDTADEDLLDALGRAPTTQILTVDRDPAAVATYAHLRLMAARAAQHLDATDNTVASLSALIGEKARQFLFARLVVHEIVARPDLLRPERRGDLVALLETDHQTLFSVAINRLTETHPAFAPLLEALAMAPGRGIPRSDRIWVIMANAIAAPGVRVTEADIDALLVAAAPYIMLDSEDGQSVYRLAHRTFQEAFHTLGPF